MWTLGLALGGGGCPGLQKLDLAWREKGDEGVGGMAEGLGGGRLSSLGDRSIPRSRVLCLSERRVDLSGATTGIGQEGMQAFGATFGSSYVSALRRLDVVFRGIPPESAAVQVGMFSGWGLMGQGLCQRGCGCREAALLEKARCKAHRAHRWRGEGTDRGVDEPSPPSPRRSGPVEQSADGESCRPPYVPAAVRADVLIAHPVSLR
uniref:Uncharacterized protein n=1 Tax=Chromera velia CCMP2878 TaxID=1169474 RepID=A0A0G4I6B3_9ALVE|eukprot:Cvel_11328.t1-p1 / transcript=Cvel_11328.t1 / gene=Cvel_11328 / organism=Chromera_velia_CCMP2878 / gene_product=hypothetical protein / transcript_product=hypothetical protein / location=Cvel_scaffold709:25053-26335(-) / protein_length=205 / sequence_SO=supercontig / SO=protein_coding / is_pseudo=false